MEVLENIIHLLQFEMEKPTMYGWFHLLSIFVMILLTIYLIKTKNNDRKVLFVLSLIMIFLEIYKQFSFSYDDFVWEYQWYSFPFQFCSTPMYIALLSSLSKNEKLRNHLNSFLATFGLIAGLSVMIYPNTVFIREVLINIQTMVHHGFMVVMGIYLLATQKVDLSIKTVFKGAKVFLVLMSIALIGNIITYYIGIDGGLELFYISPYHTSQLPVFNIIYDHTPYPVFLFTYLFVFTLGALIPIGVGKLFTFKKRKLT